MERPLFLIPVFISLSSRTESKHSLNCQIVELLLLKRKTLVMLDTSVQLLKGTFFKVQKSFCKLLSTVRRGSLGQKNVSYKMFGFVFTSKCPKKS